MARTYTMVWFAVFPIPSKYLHPVFHTNRRDPDHDCLENDNSNSNMNETPACPKCPRRKCMIEGILQPVGD